MNEDSESASNRLKSSWDANADLWTDAIRSASIPSRVAGTDQAVIDAITQTKPGTLIDIGCGEGWLVRRVQQEIECNVVGIDASPLLIERARQADPTGRYAVLPYEQLTELPSDMPRSFETAVCNFSLFDEDLSTTLCGIRQLLSDSGQLVIQTLHPWTGASEQAYQDGWIDETFSSLASPASPSAWQAMPWYFRTLGSWVQQMSHAGMAIHAIQEPLDKSLSQPLSMVLICQKLADTGQSRSSGETSDS